MHREEAPRKFRKHNPETMRRYHAPSRAVWLCVVLITILTGCEDAEQKKAKYMGRGERYLSDKNYEKARVEFKNVLQIDPKNADGSFLLGRTEEAAGYLVKHNKIDAAISELQSAIQQNPEFEDLQFMLADAYTSGGKPEKAETTYRQLIENHNLDPVAWRAGNALAVLYLKQQKQDQAVELLDQVLRENPKDNQALLIKGQLALQKGDTEDAIGLLRRVLQNQPENAKLNGLLAQALLLDNQTDLARDHLEKAVMLAPSDKTYRLQLARVLTFLKDYDRALEHVEFVLQTTPDTLEALQVKSNILGMKGDRQGVLETLKEIQTAHPELAEADFQLGRLYRADKKFDDAEAEFEETLEKLPESEIALAGLVDTLIAAGEPAKAENRIKNFLADNPDKTMVRMMLGRLY
ncbi:MAG: tetratricopeptide repeat protein, partial [Methylococcales bacterium]